MSVTSKPVPEAASAARPGPAAVRRNDWRQVAVPAPEAFRPALPVSVVVPCFEVPGALALTLAGLQRQDYPRALFEVVVVDDGSSPPLRVPASTALPVRTVRQERRGFGLARARNAGARAALHDILVFLDGDVIAEAGLLAAHARWHHAVSDALTLGFCASVSIADIDAAAIHDRPASLRELFARRPCDTPWLERHMARTADLTSGHDDLFRAVTGHNLGISRAFFEEAGGFDESFARYGGEDTEFGYRVQMRGGLLVPARDAFGWHQGRWAEGRAGKERDQALQGAKLAHLVADPGFRRAAPGRSYTVPRHVVAIEAGDAPAGRLVESAEALLADPEGDLAVCIEAPGDPDARCALEEALGPDPRVRVLASHASHPRAPSPPDPRVCVSAAGAALDAFPVSPFHIALPAGAGPAPGLVRGLRSALGDAATATAVLGDGAQVSVARAWVLHRARRAGGSAADYGEARRIPAARLELGRALPVARRAGGVRSPRGVRAVAARVWAEARHVRGFRTGWRFSRWLAAGLRWWLRRDAGAVAARVWAEARHVRGFRTGWRFARWLAAGLRWWPRRDRGAAAARVWAEARHVRGFRTGRRFARWLAAGLRWWPRRGGGAAAAPAAAATRTGAQADPPLGAEIAVLGARARAVFAASSRVARELDGRHVDVVLADTPAQAAGIAAASIAAAGIAAPGIATAGIEAPAVILCEAPALAAPAFDPALDNPIGWVREVEPRVAVLGPPRLLPPGVRAHRVVRAEDRDALRHCHHLEDVAAFHAGTAERAGTLARLAARGVPVHLADRGPALPALLGAELHGFMTEDIRGAGAAAREALSIATRRAALRAHSLRARARQVCAAALADPPELARISVLLATRRPGHLAAALANVARQRYPRLELVLALHGPGFAPEAVERAIACFPHPVEVLRLDRSRPLGSVLNAAADAARGALLAKMDDDDVYGAEHLWDLALAREYSGAALVGKFPATVYLARGDRTVRRRRVRSETWSASITGGAMLIGRADLERAGGWRRAPRHVDAALVEDVLRAGGGVYRTHDTGYLMVRHGDRHTWEAEDAEFLVEAESVHRGWRPALAGIEDAPPPHGPDASRDDA